VEREKMPLQGDQMALAHHAPPKEDSGPRAAFDIWTHLVQRVSMLFSNVTHLPYILHNTKTPVKLTRRLLFSVHDVFSPQVALCSRKGIQKKRSHLFIACSITHAR